MIRIKRLTYSVLPALLLLVAFAFLFTSAKAQTPAFADSKTSSNNLSYKIIPSEDKTWGYDILMDSKVKIHQPSRPAMPGKKGFANKTAAGKVAELAITKMKKGEMPPTITVEELKKLNAI